MKRWALMICIVTSLSLNSTGFQGGSDIEGSGEGDDYMDESTDDNDDPGVGANTTDSNAIAKRWPARRAVAPKTIKQKIWKEIRREVRDMKNNILPGLASNVSWMEVDFREMNHNFFSMVGDVRFIKNEVLYIKQQAHVIWENVTDTRRDHKRMNKTLWWILKNVTLVAEDVEKTVRQLTEIQNAYGKIGGRLDNTVEKVVEVATLTNTMREMGLEFVEIKMSLNHGTARMTDEINIVREIVSHLAQAIIDIKQYVVAGFLQVDHEMNISQSRVLANISDIALKLASQGTIMGSITENVMEMGQRIFDFSERIISVWNMVANLSEHLNDVAATMVHIENQIDTFHAKINSIGNRVIDIQNRVTTIDDKVTTAGTDFATFASSVDQHFGIVTVNLGNVHDIIISNVSYVRGDLHEVKNQLRDIRQVIAEKCEGRIMPPGVSDLGEFTTVNNNASRDQTTHSWPQWPDETNDVPAFPPHDIKPPVPSSGDEIGGENGFPHPGGFPPTGYPTSPLPTWQPTPSWHPGSSYPPTTIHPSTTMHPPTTMPIYPIFPPTTLYPTIYPTTILPPPGYPYPPVTVYPTYPTTMFPQVPGYPPTQMPYPPSPTYPGYPTHPEVPTHHPPGTMPATSGPSYPPFEGDPGMPVSLPLGPAGPGLPIGYGDQFTHQCACACPCDCSCQTIEPGVITTTNTHDDRFDHSWFRTNSFGSPKQCYCLCSCPCPPDSGDNNGRPMVPPFQGPPPPMPSGPSGMPEYVMPPDKPPSFFPTNIPTQIPPHVSTYIPPHMPTQIPPHVPTYIPPHIPTPVFPEHPEYPRPCPVCPVQPEQNGLFNMLDKIDREITQMHQTMTSFGNMINEHFETTRLFIIDRVTKRVDQMAAELANFFRDSAKRQAELLSSIRLMQNQLDEGMEYAAYSLEAIGLNIMYFQSELGNLLSLGGLDEKRQPNFLPAGMRPPAQTSGIQMPQFTPPGQMPSYLPSRPQGRPHGRPQLNPPTRPPHQSQWDPTKRPAYQSNMFPVNRPAYQPVFNPTNRPTYQPTPPPSDRPLYQPTPPSNDRPSYGMPPNPTNRPSYQPALFPPNNPSYQLALNPTNRPSYQLLPKPTNRPSYQLPPIPTQRPSYQMPLTPTHRPSYQPLPNPTQRPSYQMPLNPTHRPLYRPPSNIGSRPLQKPPPHPPYPPSWQQPVGPPGYQPQRPVEGPYFQPTRRPSGRPLDDLIFKPTRPPAWHPTPNLGQMQMPTRPPGLSYDVIPIQGQNYQWPARRDGTTGTSTSTTELSTSSEVAQRMFSSNGNGEEGLKDGRKSAKKRKMKSKKKCVSKKKHIGAKQHLPQRIPEKEIVFSDIKDESDNEHFDEVVEESFPYNADVTPEGMMDVSNNEIALPTQNLDMVQASMDPFTFNNLLQEHINHQLMNAFQPGSAYRSKRKRFPFGRGRGKSKNRYKLLTRPMFPMMPGFPFIPPPIGLRPQIPPVDLPNPLVLRPPPIPNMFGQSLHGINGSPYSVSYNDGRGNSWNVNINRRNYSGMKANDLKSQDDEEENEDEDESKIDEETIVEEEEEKNNDNEDPPKEITETTENQ